MTKWLITVRVSNKRSASSHTGTLEIDIPPEQWLAEKRWLAHYPSWNATDCLLLMVHEYEAPGTFRKPYRADQYWSDPPFDEKYKTEIHPLWWVALSVVLSALLMFGFN